MVIILFQETFYGQVRSNVKIFTFQIIMEESTVYVIEEKEETRTPSLSDCDER